MLHLIVFWTLSEVEILFLWSQNLHKIFQMDFFRIVKPLSKDLEFHYNETGHFVD